MATPGLTSAPLTRAALILTATLCPLTLLTTDPPAAPWPLRPLAYENTTSLLFALVALYHLRVIERLWGTRKFASFLLATAPYTLLIPPLLCHLTHTRLAAGPTAPLFALLAQYHAAVPARWKYGDVPVSSKVATYAVAAQVALAEVPGSLVAAAVGWCVGVAWRRGVLVPGAGWRVWWVGGEGVEGVGKAKGKGREGVVVSGRGEDAAKGLRRR